MVHKSKFARYRPKKDIGLRYSDQEFAEEFIAPVKSTRQERSPSRHSKASHDMQYFPGE